MTTHEEWTDQLSDYLDDELSASDRHAVETHLAGCPDCTRTLQELTRVVATASSLPPQPPREDLWEGITQRIGGSVGGRRRFSFTLPELAAAAVVLVTLSGGAAALLMSRIGGLQSTNAASGSSASESADVTSGAATADASGPESAPVPEIVPALSYGEAQYDAAVLDLERALESGRGRLDEATVAVVEQNLSIIDRAIAEARSALAADPSNGYLSSHLVEARRRKLNLLRRTTALMTEAN